MLFRPHGRYVWDFWFAWGHGRLHAYYLQADIDACEGDPQKRHDLASVGHAVSNSHGFVEVGGPPVLQARPSPAWDDLSIWTGSVAHLPCGRYAMLYTSRHREEHPKVTPYEVQRPQHIGLAWSSDLARWERSPRCETAPLIPNVGAPRFDGVNWRDPYLLADGSRVTAFITARLASGRAADAGGGAIAMTSSRDCEEWCAPDVFWASDDFYQMEVPQVFWRTVGSRTRCYVVFSAQERDCAARRRASLPLAESRTGTYVAVSDFHDCRDREAPVFETAPRLLAASLYSGKLVDPDTAERPSFFAFPWTEPDGSFRGGIQCAGRVAFDGDGEPTLVREDPDPWPR